MTGPDRFLRVRPELRVLMAGGPARAEWGDDVSLIADAARAHVLPTLDTALEDCQELLSPDARRALAMRRVADRHRRQVYESGLARLVQTLDDLDAEFLVVKGLANESRWYRPQERRMSDIDIVLHPRDLPRVSEILPRLAPHDPNMDRSVRALTAGGVEAVDLDTEGCYIDVHAKVFKSLVPTRDERPCWDRAVRVDLAHGVAARVLDPEHALVHATVHALIDRFCFLAGPTDIARMLARDDLDWNVIEETVEREGWTDAVAFGMWRVADLAGLPGAVELPRPPSRWWETVVWPGELVGAGRADWHRTIPRSKLIPLAYNGRLGDTVRGFVRSAVPTDAELEYRFAGLASTRLGRVVQWQTRWLSKYLPVRSRESG